MSIANAQIKIKEIELEILKVKQENDQINNHQKIQELENQKREIIIHNFTNLSSYDRVKLARFNERSNIYAYIDSLFDCFIEFHGDRLYKDDPAIIGGIAYFKDIPVTIIGHLKGRTLQENIDCNFAMANPEGYRKAIRLMKQADKFQRPIITFIDTPGAYPGDKAEEHGQAEAIAKCLYEMSLLKVPVIAVVIGEGGSGGALALSVANRIVMLENAIYSILSPEGFATILWKDASKAKEASQLMELTAKDLYQKQIIDAIINEPLGGVQENPTIVMMQLSRYLDKELKSLMALKPEQLQKQRYSKFRKMGSFIEESK